ncbi:hypothetical protein GALMADRAFT_224047 [Galerina marginata CBS 339.88]|uniref:Major facilitator superfamily (MFS) profile domain-containing protein n=1 Tax=Galerina marginata (strain CBS 339.88) TaxID=685588 RepID=A0A067TFW8_GALM3|nr:hypothetical protein GALMADRAFT_224047 [Galerina marginata CBS 339.88]
MSSESEPAYQREDDPLTTADDNRVKPTPLPKAQLFGVFLIQTAEPITSTVIYPFINQFVRETGITGGDETKTGYYAGIIESAFYFAESLTCVPWGYMSDKYGRRPILLCAPVGLALSMLIFGSSTTFWPLVVSRCFQGIFNGNVGVAKSIIAEMTDSTNRADAYAFMPTLWTIGITVGPILGGLLSNPAKRWPNTWGQISYLQTHPYFLPCLTAALVALMAFGVAFVTLKETLPSKVAQERLLEHQNAASSDSESLLLNYGDSCDYGTNHYHVENSTESGIVDPSEPVTPANGNDNTLRAAFTRPVLKVLLNIAFLTFCDMCHYVLVPLMYSTPVEYGGLGLDPFRIGVALGAFGFITSLVQAKVLGGLIRKYGSRTVYRASFPCLLGCFAMYPILKLLAQRGQGVDGVVVACIIVQLGFQTPFSMAYGAAQVILIESVPEGGPIGTVNGVAQMIGSGLRSIAPTFASSLFSISLQKGLAGGNMVYYLLLALTLVWMEQRMYFHDQILKYAGQAPVIKHRAGRS